MARPLQTGDQFPTVVMVAPTAPAEKRYLGLSDEETFVLADMSADVIYVEIMNTHCFSCKKQARSNNQLFALISSDSKTKDKIKILAIAVGNNASEVTDFKETYQVSYPIIPDPGFTLHQAVGFTKTPYSFYIRKDPRTGNGHIMGTHLGANIHYEALFEKLSAMLSLKVSTTYATKPKADNDWSTGADQPSPKEIELAVESAFSSLGATLDRSIDIRTPLTGLTYVGSVKAEMPPRKLFAVAEGRIVPCDVCHDAYYIYVFDVTGKIVSFESIQLSKYDNQPFDEDDLSSIRSRIVGRYIFQHIPFDSQVDAISAATITSQVIYDSFTDGQRIFEVLKAEGVLE